MIGALREMVTETLGALQAAELVVLHHGRIPLKNLVGLRSQMEEGRKLLRG